MRKLITAMSFSILAVIISIWIARLWIIELEAIFGYFTWFMLIGMVFIPCFAMIYVTTSLFFSQKIKESIDLLPSISILIACYNEESNIIYTLNSILEQKYPNKLQIIVSDDGSTDNSLSLIRDFINNPILNKGEDILLIDNKINKGKSNALNKALKKAKYENIITIDSDTTLHKKALENLVKKFKSDNYGAVAGAIRVNNDKKNIITRLQYWDYILGIASIKQSQGIYNMTLVAQGAFSIYKKELLEKLKWSETMGEDIVLSWDILGSDNKIGHANDAIVFTNVPESYKMFFKQRKRWSIGLIEAFRRNGNLLYKPTKGLPFFWYNLFFPYIDISYMLFFLPSVIAAVFFKCYLMAGILTLLLLPLGITLNLVIITIQQRINKKVGLSYNNDIIGFILFILFFQLIQTPATIVGYFSEIFKMKKSWGTR